VTLRASVLHGGVVGNIRVDAKAIDDDGNVVATFTGTYVETASDTTPVAPPDTAPPPTYAIFASAVDHVTGLIPYDGYQFAAGYQYPWIGVAQNADPAFSITKVDWTLDAPLTGAVHTVTNSPFFDYGGVGPNGVIPWDTTGLGTTTSPQQHVLRARVYIAHTTVDGVTTTTQDVQATVTVQNPVVVQAPIATLASVIADNAGPPNRIDSPWTGWALHAMVNDDPDQSQDWAKGARGYGVNSATFPYILMWFQLFAASTPTYQVLAHIRRMWMQKYVAGQGWVYVNNTDIIASNSAYFTGNYGGGVDGSGIVQQLQGLVARSAAEGGGMSFDMAPIAPGGSAAAADVAHFWTPSALAYVGDALAVHVSVHAKRIAKPGQPASVVDSARFELGASGDSFKTTAGWGAGITNYGGDMGEGRMVRLDGTWRTASVTALTAAGKAAAGVSIPYPATLSGANAYIGGITSLLTAHVPTLQVAT